MPDYPPFNKKLSLFAAILTAVVLCICVSCSDSTPELSSATGYVIFDYDSMESYPSMRLAAFVQTVSEVRRVEKISVFNRKNRLEWTRESPVVFSDEKSQWTGYTDFVCAKGISIPLGLYDFTYCDGEGRTEQTVFSIYYDEKNAAITAKEFLDKKPSNVIEKIALYSEQGMLLYFGDKKASWKDDALIFKTNGQSSYYRTCYKISGDNSIFMMPPVYKNIQKIEKE